MITKASNQSVYQLKITLKQTLPPIWRRIQIREFSLSHLHELIQVAMGWERCHLFEFVIDGKKYGDPNMDDVLDTDSYHLKDVLDQGISAFQYVYDFGDWWDHEIVVEKCFDAKNETPLALCLDGDRACPPEDVGGVPGFVRFVAAISDPNDPEHQRMLDWMDCEYDPERFDIDAVNEMYQMLK